MLILFRLLFLAIIISAVLLFIRPDLLKQWAIQTEKPAPDTVVVTPEKNANLSPQAVRQREAHQAVENALRETVGEKEAITETAVDIAGTADSPPLAATTSQSNTAQAESASNLPGEAERVEQRNNNAQSEALNQLRETFANPAEAPAESQN